jgi:pimeloyl-ACP methyl ester carboxylesterase
VTAQEPQKKALDVGGLRIDYVEAGAGEPVVLLDGWRGRLSPLQTQLSQQYRAITLNLNEKLDSAKDFASRMAGPLGNMVDGNYTLIGTSRAADLAAWLAVQAGDHIDALVLIAPLAIRPRMLDGVHDEELEIRLADITCPTLVVFGTDDRLVHREAARVYAERIPNVNVSLVYDAGHVISADRPDALTRLVADYVERRDTFVVGRGGSPNTL